MCYCCLAITSCQEDPSIGSRMEMLGNKAIIAGEMARPRGTELYHGITGQKRQSSLVIMEVGLGMITCLPKTPFSLTFDNHFSFHVKSLDNVIPKNLT